MKTITSLLVLFLTFFLLFSGAAAAETITIRSDSWPPYNDEPDSAAPGYMIEVLKDIFDAKGINIDYQLMGWEESLEAVEKGQFDAVIGTDDEEAPNLLFPVEPFGNYQNGFFVKKDKPWLFKGVKSLSAIRLGVIAGYDYGGEVGSYVDSHQESDNLVVLKSEDALPELLNMLVTDEVDVVVDNIPVVLSTLKDLAIKPGEVTFAGTDTLSKTDLFIAFSPTGKNSAKYAQIFDEGIKGLRSSGKLKQILVKYGIEDWK